MQWVECVASSDCPGSPSPCYHGNQGSGLTRGKHHCELSMKTLHTKLWTTHIHKGVNRLDASIIPHTSFLSVRKCLQTWTHTCTHIPAPQSLTPTWVAWIITFNARLLGNSKPTCHCSVCASVYFLVKQSQWRVRYLQANTGTVHIHRETYTHKRCPDPEAKITFRASESGYSVH